MILIATKKELARHNAIRHGPAHKTGDCHFAAGLLACLWGFSNPKHGDDKGGKGQAARRKLLARGKKYWKMAKEKK